MTFNDYSVENICLVAVLNWENPKSIVLEAFGKESLGNNNVLRLVRLLTGITSLLPVKIQ